MTIKTITRIYTRQFSDTGQAMAYVEWIDHKGRNGTTEGPARHYNLVPIGTHMQALFDRALRQGLTIGREG